MKKLLLSTFVVASLLSCTTSKRITYLDIPQEKGSSFEPVNVDSILARYSGYDGVFLNSERTIEHFGTKGESAAQFLLGNLGMDWSFCDIEKYRYVVLNPEATWLTHVEYWSKPNQLYITITNPDGSVRRYGLAHLKEETEDGETVYRFIFPKIKRGSLVEFGTEYSYSIKEYMPPLEHDIALQFRVPCEKLSFSYIYPDWWQIQVKDNGPYSNAAYERSFDPENKKALIRYSGTNIPSIPNEPYSPYFKEVCNYLHFHVASLSMGGLTLEQKLTWDNIAEVTHDNLIKTTKRGKGRLDINNLARKFSDVDTLQYAIIQNVVDYVRDSMELVAGRGKTDYHRIVRQKKGNLLQLIGLTRAILAELKIPAEILMIHSAEDGFLNDNYVYFTEYTIPAIKTEINGKPYVLLPYGEKLPLGYVPPFLQGQQALAIDADAHWSFWTVPRSTREENTTRRNYQLTLGDEGDVSVEETGTLSGAAAYVMREVLLGMTDSELEKTFKEWATFTGADVTLETYEVENLDNPDSPLIMKLNYDILNLLTVTPEEVIFHTGGLFAPISGSGMQFDPNNRQLPISIRADEQHDKNIEIIFPKNWCLTTALSDVTTENIFGAVHGQYSVGDGELGVNQSILLNHVFADKANYPQLLDLVGNQSKLYLPNLVFTVSDAAP